MKINMNIKCINDTKYYEWENSSASQSIIFVGGAFIAIQSYFDLLESVSNHFDTNIIAIPLLYQDTYTYSSLDFHLDTQINIIHNILNSMHMKSNTIFMGVDVGASIASHIQFKFQKYILINPFLKWNKNVPPYKFISSIENNPISYFILRYLFKIIKPYHYFHIPDSLITKFNINNQIFPNVTRHITHVSIESIINIHNFQQQINTSIFNENNTCILLSEESICDHITVFEVFKNIKIQPIHELQSILQKNINTSLITKQKNSVKKTNAFVPAQPEKVTPIYNMFQQNQTTTQYEEDSHQQINQYFQYFHQSQCPQNISHKKYVPEYGTLFQNDDDVCGDLN